MSFEHLLYDVDGDGVATITINRPDKLNALNAAVLSELEVAFRQARADSAVKGVTLTGSGEKSFVAGADIRQFSELGPLDGHRFAIKGQAIFNRIEEMTKPVVAAVNGYALGGGCELAMACHLRVASENAIFGQPEVNLGILPGYGGTQRLPRLVGRGIALELILTGERISAQRAYEIGLANRVVTQEELLETSKKLILAISSKAPVAVSMAMDAVRASELPMREGLRYEAALFGQACATLDFREGVSAFLERRKPDFVGG